MEGERRYYSVEEAANVLDLSPARVRGMLATGELEGLPPGATAGGDWLVLMKAGPNKDQSPDEALPPEEPPDDLGSTPEPPEEAADVEEEQAEGAEGEDLTRGDKAATIHEPTAPSGWVSTQQAARALGISPRTVRWHIDQGNLEAKPEGEGVKRAWLVSIDSLQALRDKRQAAGELPRGYRTPAESADIAAESSGNAIRELADRLVEEAARASEFRVRLELSERAQSSLEEELNEERRRREAAERERDDLRRELESAREARESPVRPSTSDTSTAGTGSPQTPREEPSRQAPQQAPRGRRRGLLGRLFGGR